MGLRFKMFGNQGTIIGLSKKVKKYKLIVEKLVNKKELAADEKEFLEKEEIGIEDGSQKKETRY